MTRSQYGESFPALVCQQITSTGRSGQVSAAQNADQEQFSGNFPMLMKLQWVDACPYQRMKHNDLPLEVKHLSCCF